jgi:uncharacterized Zn finger protein
MNNKMNIDLNNVKNIACDDCESEHFSPTFIIKKLSALMSPSGKETLIPLQTFKCDKCGHINELFLQGLTN